ncbi:hypothetical protein AAVH_03769 [Aphelenchoides avenae]|nr:hypothetical protein AAVH_03769 [Aphelenchus avenae]
MSRRSRSVPHGRNKNSLHDRPAFNLDTRINRSPDNRSITPEYTLDDEDVEGLRLKKNNQKDRRKPGHAGGGKNSLDKRPAFNLDTRIEGYEDVDDRGKYIRKYTDSYRYQDKNKQKSRQVSKA